MLACAYAYVKPPAAGIRPAGIAPDKQQIMDDSLAYDWAGALNDIPVLGVPSMPFCQVRVVLSFSEGGQSFISHSPKSQSRERG